MRLFLLPKTFNGENTLTLSGKEYNYLVRVLRLKEGQKIMGRDGKGDLWELTISQIDKDKNSCTLETKTSNKATEYTDALPQERPLKPIILYQCIPKGRKIDDIIKKATETGVQAIVLVNSENCVANIKGKEESKLSRFDSIVKEAIQQSGSLVPTIVDGPIEIKDIPRDLEERARGNKTVGLVLHQCKIKEDQSDLPSTLSKVKNFDGTTALLVGAEGGLTDKECQILLDAGFKAILLKTNILRCETASIYAIGAIQTLLETS